MCACVDPIIGFSVGVAGAAKAHRCAAQGAHQAEKSRQQAPAAAQPERADRPRVQTERGRAQAHGRDQKGNLFVCFSSVFESIDVSSYIFG